MNEQRAERTRELIASYRYSVNRFEPQIRKVRPASTARDRQRQINNDSADGNLVERRWSRPTTPAVIEKEALDKEIMQLKKTNNALSCENVKLKTNNLSVEQQFKRLKQALQQQPKTKHLVRTDSAATTAKISILKRQLDVAERNNMALKQNIKYARLSELQAENQSHAAELIKIRELLQQEKKVSQALRRERREMIEQYSHKRNEMQDAILKLQQEIHYLRQKNQPAAERVRARSRLQMRKFDHLSPAMNDLKTEIQSLNQKLKKSQQQVNELRNHHSRSLKSTKDEGIQADQKCPTCKSLRSQNTKSKSKIQRLKAQIKQLSKNRVMKDEMIRPTDDESRHLRIFITLKLTELGISLNQASDFFLDLDENSTEMSLLDLVGIFTADPFCLVTNRYHQIMVFHLCLSDQQDNQNGMITIHENKSFAIDIIREYFRKFLGEFTIPSLPQRKKIFQKIAEFLADHDTKIRMHGLFKMSSNEGEISINEYNFRRVMGEFGVDQDCIVEMMRNMVTGSPDLNHLDFRILFQNFMVVEDENDDQSPIIRRSAEENSISPNPESFRHTSEYNEGKDILFFDLDPSQLSSTQQAFHT